MSEDVILLAGLPGCGKTTHLCQMCRDGWLAFDDFKANAFDDCSEFGKSRKFRALISALRDGLKCAVADIDFCKTKSREEAVSVLLAEIPGVKIAWRFFVNDPSVCEENIRSRKRPSLQIDLKKLHEYSKIYDIPHGANVLPIGRTSQS
jgi:tRNA splicing ligase